mmetsp:Transcript_15706/g.34148  ORF Transcript_15706/g.34148 Transcript_15706/m.34148 type:complete len:99 (+) Transcript_15706:1097-1393(+)
MRIYVMMKMKMFVCLYPSLTNSVERRGEIADAAKILLTLIVICYGPPCTVRSQTNTAAADIFDGDLKTNENECVQVCIIRNVNEVWFIYLLFCLSIKD